MFSQRLIGTRLLVVAIWVGAAAGAASAQTTADKPKPINDVLTDDVLRNLGVERSWVEANDKLRNALTEAVSAFARSDGDTTLNKLEDAKKSEDSLPPPRLLVARLLLAANNIPQARQFLQLVFKENRQDCPEMYLLLGNLALAEGRLTDAYLNLTQAGMLVGSQDDGRSSTVKGRWDDARRNDFLREVYAGKVAVFEQLQDWPQANNELIPWMAMNPDDPIAHLRKGRISYLEGVLTGQDEANFKRYYGEAKKEFMAAYDLQKAKGVYKNDPEIERPEVVLLNLHTAANKLDLAEEEISQISANESAIAADAKEGSRIFTQISIWYLRQGRFTEARKFAEKATALDVSAPALKALSAMLAYYANDPSAENDFEKMFQANPADFFASNYLALISSEAKDDAKKNRAVQLAETNYRLNPQSPEAISTLGWVYYNAGRFQEAARVMQAIAQGAQISPDTAFYFARVIFKISGMQGDTVRNLLKSAVEAKGPFKHRGEATRWLKGIDGNFDEDSADAGSGSAASQPAPKVEKKSDDAKAAGGTPAAPK